jgi:hypothetical protein
MISAPDGEGLGAKPSALPTEQAGKTVVAGHTPGPWSTDGLQICCDTGIHIIAECSEWLPEFRDERRANARLIAAAPELLEALQRLSALTPGAANAADARSLHMTVKAIADEAVSKALPQQAAVLGSSLREGER